MGHADYGAFAFSGRDGGGDQKEKFPCQMQIHVLN
jgi:hypothetical protein